jgi:opacity protein-like surface antigen
MNSILKYVALCIVLASVTSASAQSAKTCTADGLTCTLKLRGVTEQYDLMPDGKNLHRVIIFSPDMKRDGSDFSLMVGGLMIVINPSSTADERGELMMKILSSGGGKNISRWGFAWQLGQGQDDAIRVIAERL